MAGSQMSAKKRGGDGKTAGPKSTGGMSGAKSTTFTGPLKPAGKSTKYTGVMAKKK